MMKSTQPTFPQKNMDRSSKNPSKPPSLSPQSLSATYPPILITLGVFAAFTTMFYLVVYVRTGIQQALWAAMFMLLAVVFIPFVYVLIRKGAFIPAGICTLLGVSIAYGINEILWSGLTPYYLVGGVLMIFLTGNLVLPHKRRVWLSAIILYVVYIALANYFHPFIRYKVSELPILLPYAIGTIILLLLVQATLIIRSLRTRTIRSRLLINFILLVLTPVIVSSIISSILSAQNAQEREYAQLESVVTLKESEVDAWISNLKTSLSLAIPAPERTWVFASSLKLNYTNVLSIDVQLAPTAGYIETDLKNLITQSQLFNELYLLNSQGKIFISTNQSIINSDQSGETYFIEGLKNTYISPITQAHQMNNEGGLTSEADRFSLILSMPVVNAIGETVGVLAGHASLDKLREIMLERAGLGNTGETFLISPQFVLITESRFQGYTAGDSFHFDTAIEQALTNKTNGKATYRSYRGATVIGSHRWLPVLQLLLIAEKGQTEALMPTYQTLGINLAVVAIATLFALVAGWYAARGITNPLSKLSKTAEAVAAGNLTVSAEVEAEDEVGALANSFNSMTDQLRFLLEGLEQRVAERTEEVELRSLQLQVAAEVARETTATRDLSELLNRAVNLVSQNFGFYHTGLFLIDERREYAVLSAATGDAGQQMLRNGHKLAVSQSGGQKQQSLIGFVSNSGVARIASDVGADSIHIMNPLLPNTRSEVALPLKVANQVIGVLDVQSTDEGAFDEGNVGVLQTLADQLAIAIENARLFQAMNQTVRELETVYGQYTREAWISLKSHSMETRGETVPDYRYRGLAIETTQELNAEASEALKIGQTVVKTELNQSALAIPLRLRGQTIGVVNLRFEGQELPVEAVNTYEEIANRLVLVLENARLLQEAQQLAKREQHINLISTQIRSSPTTDSILRNTVRELGNALGASRTFVQLGLQAEESGNGKQHTNTPEAAKTNGKIKEHQE